MVPNTYPLSIIIEENYNILRLQSNIIIQEIDYIEEINGELRAYEFLSGTEGL